MKKRGVSFGAQQYETLDPVRISRELASECAELTPVARRVLESRYLLRDSNGIVIETPALMFARVAASIAVVERKWGKRDPRDVASEFFRLMASLRFLPNSPTLMNAGTPEGQLSACFVLPLEDRLSSVFETLKQSALIHKTGGGTGFGFGHIRPAGSRIGSGRLSPGEGKASGPVAFLRLFDSTTEVVRQGGVRRGANMGILPVSHPDIEEFILSKLSGGIHNFNISVTVSDAFMKTVEAGSNWKLINPRDGRVARSIPAKNLWSLMAECAWATGDPGVVFIDRVNEWNPTPEIGPMESTNPCGEQPLLPYESCNLGSFNVRAYVKDATFDWKSLERDVALAVRFLDDAIEANSYPVGAIQEITYRNRKIGLGVMGWADALLEWRIPYDSEEAVKRAEELIGRLEHAAVRASEKLAEERGAFPEFQNSLWARRGDRPRRNATVTTIAPTGTISIIAGASSGIEPIFSLAYERKALDGERFEFVHPVLPGVLKKSGVRSAAASARVMKTGSAQRLRELAPAEKRYLRIASEIKPEWHVRMQAAFQKHTENAVSKTVNLPAKSTPAQIRKIFEMAYRLGCKGITVFREGSKGVQVLTRGVRRKKRG